MTQADVYLIRRIAGGEVYKLTAALRVGRKEGCEILLTDIDASRLHARLTLEETGAHVEDLNSKNGTFVNDARIAGKRRLEVGDSLRFVEEQFEVALESSQGRPAAWQPPKAGTVGIEEWRRRVEQEAGGTDPALTPVDQPCLVVLAGMEPGRRIELLAPSRSAKKWTIGSDADREIRFAEVGVSGFHATFSTDGRHWKIVDEMSKNGVIVNKEPVLERFLGHGDRIGLGPVLCQLLLPGGKVVSGGAGAPRAVSRPQSAPSGAFARLAAALGALFGRPRR